MSKIEIRDSNGQVLRVVDLDGDYKASDLIIAEPVIRTYKVTLKRIQTTELQVKAFDKEEAEQEAIGLVDWEDWMTDEEFGDEIVEIPNEDEEDEDDNEDKD